MRRVSLVSDQLGYDVVAPRIGARPRLLEVKATTTSLFADSVLYLSRAEAEAGARLADWALVMCNVDDVAARTGDIVGWCQRRALDELLPRDSLGARWQSAAIDIRRIELQPGLPRPTS